MTALDRSAAARFTMVTFIATLATGVGGYTIGQLSAADEVKTARDRVVALERINADANNGMADATDAMRFASEVMAEQRRALEECRR